MGRAGTRVRDILLSRGYKMNLLEKIETYIAYSEAHRPERFEASRTSLYESILADLDNRTTQPRSNEEGGAGSCETLGNV